MRGRRPEPAPAVFPQDEELRHVAVQRTFGVCHLVEQCEADDVRVHAQEQGDVLWLAPIRIESVLGKSAALVDFPNRPVVPVLREVVGIQLHQVFEHDPLLRHRNHQLHAAH